MPGPGLDLVGDEELAELTDVIRSGRLSRYGPDDDTFPAKVRRLEEAVAGQAGVRYALAVNAGTSALYLALAGLGIGPGDEVLAPGFTYVATLSSIVYARARPVLCEIDDTLNLDPVGRGGAHHPAHEGHRGGPHAGQPGSPRRAESRR